MELGEMKPNTIIPEKALAEIFKCHPVTIKRAVSRGELPPPIRMFGKPCWTAKSLIEHVESRLEAAKREAEEEAARIARLHV